MRRFDPGEVVALREIWEGRIFSAIPARIVDDHGDRRTLYIAPCRWKSARRRDGEWLRLPLEDWVLEDRPSEDHLLSFSFDGVAAAPILIWNERWEPRHWYVNLETPPTPTAFGFDFTDHVLDVLVSIDRATVTWKDEDELEQAIALGLFTVEDAKRFRDDGERAVERLLSREPPFDRDWTGWRPDPSWNAPELPPGWERVVSAPVVADARNADAGGP